MGGIPWLNFEGEYIILKLEYAIKSSQRTDKTKRGVRDDYNKCLYDRKK